MLLITAAIGIVIGIIIGAAVWWTSQPIDTGSVSDAWRAENRGGRYDR